MLKIIIETIGTLALVLSLGITADPITAGLILMVLVYIGYSASGAHFNPAVSMGVWALGEENSNTLVARLSGQFIGAAAGAYIADRITRVTYIPGPAASSSVAEFIFLEFLFSLIFVLLFLIILYPKSNQKRSLVGLVAGAGYAGCLMAAEPVSGFGLHPAFNTAFSTIDYLHGGNSHTHLPVYVFTPFVAALLAGVIHRKFFNRQMNAEYHK